MNTQKTWHYTEQQCNAGNCYFVKLLVYNL